MQHHHVTISGMSLVAGNSVLPMTIRNATAAATLFGWPFQIFAGAAKSLNGQGMTGERVLGPTGMRSRGLTLPTRSQGKIQRDAVAAICAWIESGNERVLLALGPLTNIAAAVTSQPSLIDKIGQIFWMGGGSKGGNETPFAEFNAYADPEALAVLLERHVPLTVADLGVCRRVRFDESDIQEIARSKGPNAPLISDLVGGYLDIALKNQRTSMAIYDPVAAAMYLMPEAFKFQDVHIDVVLSGPQRGRTIMDENCQRQRSNARLATRPDHEILKRTLIETLTHAAKNER